MHRSDVWSVGCIFAEALNRAVLFKGKDSADQMRLIMLNRGTGSNQGHVVIWSCVCLLELCCKTIISSNLIVVVVAQRNTRWQQSMINQRLINICYSAMEIPHFPSFSLSRTPSFSRIHSLTSIFLSSRAWSLCRSLFIVLYERGMYYFSRADSTSRHKP